VSKWYFWSRITPPVESVVILQYVEIVCQHISLEPNLAVPWRFTETQSPQSKCKFPRKYHLTSRPHRVGKTIITLVKQYKFVGILFTSTERDIFSVHYAKKVSKARAVVNMTFAIGDTAVYGANQSPPHLRMRSSLDVMDTHVSKLEDVQNEFLPTSPQS
jgi:hypothetical protein